MDKETATKIADLLLSMDSPINEVLELLNVADDEENKFIRKAVRKIGIDIYADILGPIFKQFPDLDSDKYYK